MAKEDKTLLQEATTENVLDAFVAYLVNTGLQKVSPDLNRSFKRQGVEPLSAKRIALLSLQRTVNLKLGEVEAGIAAVQEESETAETL